MVCGNVPTGSHNLTMDYQGRTSPNKQKVKNVQPAKFAEFDTLTSILKHRNLNMLFDIPLQVTVELGERSKEVKGYPRTITWLNYRIR